MSAWARRFRSHLSLDQIRVALNAEGSTSWRGAESDLWGEYVVGRPDPGGKVRIFRDADYIVIEISGTSDPDPSVQYVLSHVFPTLEVAESEEHGGWE